MSNEEVLNAPVNVNPHGSDHGQMEGILTFDNFCC